MTTTYAVAYAFLLTNELDIQFIDADSSLEAACTRLVDWEVDPEHYTSLEELQEQMLEMDVLISARKIELSSEEPSGIRLPMGQMRVVTDNEDIEE